jgi:hypothetical protein
MDRTIYRQGDVLLQRTSKRTMAGTPLPRRAGRVVLAEGEVTGHAHAIDSPLAELFEERTGQLFLRVEPARAGQAPAVVRHEEHAAITLEPGIYRVTRQREYSPEAIRPVAD